MRFKERVMEILNESEDKRLTAMKIVNDEYKGVISIDWDKDDVSDLASGMKKIEKKIKGNKYVKMDAGALKKIMKEIQPLMKAQYKNWDSGDEKYTKYGKFLDSGYYESFEKIIEKYI
jgi:hypothetical protein